MKSKRCYCSSKKMFWLFLVCLLANLSAQSLAQDFEWEYLGFDSTYITIIAADDSGNIFISANGVYKSTDSGLTWQLKMNVGASEMEFDVNGNIYMATSGGVFKSTDGGNTSFRIAQSIPTNEFYDIEIIPDGTLFVSSFVGIYKSNNGGISWAPTSFNGFGAIDIGINSNGIMFFANSTLSHSGIYRSTNFGSTWGNLTWNFYATALEYLDDGSVVAGCKNYPPISNGIYITTDNGDTWENTNFFNGNNLWFYDFVLDINNDIYVSYKNSIPGQTGVYLSDDYGYYWINTNLPSQSPVSCLAIDSAGYIYAGTFYNGIFRTAGRTVPVELTSFTSSVNENNVTLNWQTATETNNQGFQIERRETKDERSEEWENIVFVNGNGTTTGPQTYSYKDENLSAGKYQYRLKQIDFDGTFEYSNIVDVEILPPAKFSLEQNYPNPFNPSTKISWQSPVNSHQTLKIYDVLGNEVATLVNEYQKAGVHSKLYILNSALPSGVYLYQLKAGDFVQTRKMILLK